MKIHFLTGFLFAAFALTLASCGKSGGVAVSASGGSPIPRVEAVCDNASCM